MEIEAKRTVQVTLKLNETEARLLRNVLAFQSQGQAGSEEVNTHFARDLNKKLGSVMSDAYDEEEED